MRLMAALRRESKNQFWQRIKKERRLAEVRAAESELLRRGLTRRQVQERLVALFQPVDGTPTRAWPTPDSWQCGRRKLSPTERYENDLHWAYTHLGHVKPEDAPSSQKGSLLRLAEEKPADFHRRYHRALPNITRRQEAQEQER